MTETAPQSVSSAWAPRSFAAGRTVFESDAARVMELVLFGYFFFLGISTVFMRLGLAAEMSFSAWMKMNSFGVPLLFALAVWRLRLYAPFQTLKGEGWRYIACIGILGCIGAGLALCINRPDMDDSIYVPKALYYTEHTNAPLDYTRRGIALDNEAFSSKIFNYYETISAGAAALAHVHFLTAYHMVFPAIAGFMTVLSMALLLRIFTPRAGVIAGIAVLILLGLLLAETHRTYANLAFARAFHGKFVFLTVGITSWVYFSLRFFVMRDLFSWLALIVLAIAMIGATITSLAMLPLLALLILTAYCVQEAPIRRIFAFTRMGIGYGATLLPVCWSVIEVYSYAKENMASGSHINDGFPTDFGAQVMMLVNPAYPVTPVLFVLSVGGVLWLSPYRRFFLAWLALAIAGIHNPLSAPFVITYIATENVFWRLFYLLPFPLMACVAAVGIWEKAEAGRLRLIFCIAAGLLLLAAGLAGPTSVIRPENGASFERPRYKLGIYERRVAQLMIAHAEPGPMLAPVEIASTVLLLSSGYPQIYMREDFLRLALESCDRLEEFVLRKQAAIFAYNPTYTAEDKQGFLALTRSANRPVSIILKENAHPEVVETLAQAGYQATQAVMFGFRLYTSTPSKAAPDHDQP